MEDGPRLYTAAELRLLKDIKELELPSCITWSQTSSDDLYHHLIQIQPTEGLYTGGTFDITLSFKPTYPFEPPRAKLQQCIFHPNIDVQGNICLNILRLDWSPVLGIGAVALGLLQLFLEPSADEPLNQG